MVLVFCETKVAVTVAPPMTAPLASVTVPEIAPVPAICAFAPTDAIMATTISATQPHAER
jgi:hypothetical protein